jgi:hypothetical protein
VSRLYPVCVGCDQPLKHYEPPRAGGEWAAQIFSIGVMAWLALASQRWVNASIPRDRRRIGLAGKPVLRRGFSFCHPTVTPCIKAIPQRLGGSLLAEPCGNFPRATRRLMAVSQRRQPGRRPSERRRPERHPPRRCPPERRPPGRRLPDRRSGHASAVGPGLRNKREARSWPDTQTVPITECSTGSSHTWSHVLVRRHQERSYRVFAFGSGIRFQAAQRMTGGLKCKIGVVGCGS